MQSVRRHEDSLRARVVLGCFMGAIGGFSIASTSAPSAVTESTSESDECGELVYG